MSLCAVHKAAEGDDFATSRVPEANVGFCDNLWCCERMRRDSMLGDFLQNHRSPIHKHHGSSPTLEVDF